mgnify:CR=1 FL=1
MINKGFVILSLLAVAAIVLMPFVLSSCGMNGAHMSIETGGGACGVSQDFSHLSFMRGLMIFGLVATVLVLAIRLICYRLAVPIFLLKSIHHFKLKLSFLRQKFLASCFKPFDQLALAYATGLVQPKIFKTF